MLTSDNSDFTTLTSWDGGGHTTEISAYHTVWYSDNTNPNNLSKSYSYGSSLDSSGRKLGALYNWYVTTAGTGITTVRSEYTILNDSICPYGWRLPIASVSTDEYKSWEGLLGDLTKDQSYSLPYEIVNGGYYKGSAGETRNNASTAGHAYYWSASADRNGAYGRYLTIQNDRTLNADFGDGFAVRCVNR